MSTAKPDNIDRLRIRRRRLLTTYITFMFIFGSSCAMAADNVDHNAVLASFGASALLAIPLWIITILVHKAIRVIQPNSGSAGIKQLVASLIFFTPMEAAFILPTINLLIAGRILKELSAREPTRYISRSMQGSKVRARRESFKWFKQYSRFLRTRWR